MDKHTLKYNDNTPLRQGSQTYNVVIIGQGLAGSLLAMALLEKGLKVMVIDNHHDASSSTVAAGIINPIIGKRFTLNRDFIKHYDIAQDVYKKLEQKFGHRFWFDVIQKRLIKNQQQSQDLNNTLSDIRHHPIYSSIKIENETTPFLSRTGLSLMTLANTTMIDTPILLGCVQKKLRSIGCYLNSKLLYDDIHITEHSVDIAGISCEHLIFCEGHQAIHNPWLNPLPFLLSKGEILTLDIDTTNTFLHWGKWLAPYHQQAKLGASFEWDNLHLKPSKAVKRDLINSLHQHCGLDGKVINHQVGIRPTTKNRQPLIGKVDNTKRLYYFNGFGTKGCLLIPYYAKKVADYFALNPTHNSPFNVL